MHVGVCSVFPRPCVHWSNKPPRTQPAQPASQPPAEPFSPNQTTTPQAEEHAALEAAREDASRRLARERRVLEKQSKALLKLPTKKERSAIEALEAQIAAEREEARGAAARHRLTVERLRCQVKSLQVRGVCHCP